MAALQQALAIDPGMGEAHYVLGLVQRDLDQGPAARKSLEEAARRSPASQTSAREALADVYLQDGDYTEGDQSARSARRARTGAAPIASWRSAWRRRAPVARTRR